MTTLTLVFLLALALFPAVVGLAGSRAAAGAARYLPPAAATVLLTTFAVTVSVAVETMLSLSAYLGTVDLFPAAHPHDWSTPTLRATLPIPNAAGLATGALAVILLGRTGVHLVRVVVGARRTTAAAAALPAVGGLAIIDDTAAHAYAVPGRNRRVVVSTGMLRLLTGPQRRALLAHEQAHLRHHHHRYAQLTRLAAAANPLTALIAPAVDHAIERWADAAAVRAVGDPCTVAHALGRAALGRPAAPPHRPGAAHDHPHGLGAAHDHVVDRVRDLLDPPLRQTRVGVLLAVATMLCWASTAAVVLYIHGVIELAEATVAR
ncbi:M56 family metallopeptidase [Frankia sp. Mgl5]|uniref:M56 family metallopeptidase n=1 Tax=Frankia sp. Mgl5 TaxID=2933793 RepID=UPI00200BFE66|nr:M56 family metallopeptidase [Frankia sp. Mgl5]MCK9925871.1 M56 family metallopeptidase [Frankia sp. Mgl5]